MEGRALMVVRGSKCVCVIVVMLAVSFGGCKSREDQATGNDLPDINKLARSYVTVEDAIVRTGPGEKFRTIGKIPPKAKVHAVARDGGWLLIISKKGNAPGFIEMASAKPGEGEEQEPAAARSVAGRYETLTATQVRSGPGLHYPVVADIPKGIKLNVVDEENGWLKVESKQGRKPGYVEAGLARPASDG